MSGKAVSVSLAFLFLLSAVVSAQNLPALPQDSKISKGTFPNGVNYYVASSDRTASTAGFALVIKNSDSQPLDVLDTPSRRLNGKTLRDFLKYNDIASDGCGYVTTSSDAVKIVLPEVQIPNGTALDSLLLIVTDLTDRVLSMTDSEGAKLFSNSDCAIIVAGDVNAKTVVEDLGAMQLMIPASSAPKRETACPAAVGMLPEYEDTPEGLTVTYSFDRIPDALMGTIQYAMIRKMVGQMTAVLRDKMLRIAEAEGTAVPALKVRYISSGDSQSAERLSFHVHSDSTDSTGAKAALMRGLYDMSEGAISKDEAVLSTKTYLRSLQRRAESGSRSNNEYISLCTSSFLYGTPLSSYEQLLSFNSSRPINDTLEMKILRRFSSALTAKDTVLRSYMVRGKVDSAGKTAVAESPERFSTMLDVNLNDTLLLPSAADRKKFSAKVRTEPLSGGEMWTFSNGVRVIYKRMQTNGRMYWNVSLNGGYGMIPAMDEQKAEKIPALLKSNMRISGIPMDKFRYIAQCQDVRIYPEIDFSVMSIMGESSTSSIDLFMKSLLGIVNDSSFDLTSVTDSTSALSVIDYMDSRFSRMNDGVIVVVGSEEPDALRNRILPYIKAMRTSVALPPRRIPHESEVRRSSTVVNTDLDCMVTDMYADINLTAENYYASALAGMIVQKRLKSLLSDTGMNVDMYWKFSVRPSDCFRIKFYVERSEMPEAVVTSCGETDSLRISESYNAARKFFDSFPDIKPSDSELAAFKKVLINNHKRMRNSPSYWRETLVRRYVDAKDFETKAEDKINAVTADKVQNILNQMASGARIETVYVDVDRKN